MKNLKNQKTICHEKKLSFLFSEPAFDTIQLINSMNKTNEPFVSNIIFAFIQVVNKQFIRCSILLFPSEVYSGLLLQILICQKLKMR